jgi:hypothetical protein
VHEEVGEGCSAAGGQRVDDIAGEGTSDVEARERSKLLDGDLVSEGGLDSERAYEDVSEHGAIGQRLDGVGIGGEGAAQVGVLLQLGPGFAVYGPNAFVSRSSVDPVAGFGVNARLGAMPASNEEHGFGVVFELFPSWYAEEMVVGAALNLQWQLY